MHISDKMFEKKWGIFNHYASHIYGKRQGLEWNECVKRLDVKKIAEQLHEMGAGYYFITLTHGTKHMLAPNSVYDELLGAKPGENCAERDIVLDLYDALSKYGIDLYLYYNASGPCSDEEEAKKLGYWYDENYIWTPERGLIPYDWRNAVPMRDGIPLEFVKKWAQVLEVFSKRYQDKVCGWWIDSCYDFTGFHSGLLKLYYDAAKSGNPNALVACNNGVKNETRKWYEEDEFTAGEFNELNFVPKSRFIDGAQNHILAPMGKTWWQPEARYDNDYMREYISRVNRNGGVVTVDVHVDADGSFVSEQMESLMLKDL